jgi:hypothetical protein
VGDTAKLTMEVTRNCPEPEVRHDLAAALAAALAKVQHIGEEHTDGSLGMGSLGVGDLNAVTRQRRVDVSISKMEGGKRRPCCFDLSACIDPELSKIGKRLQMSYQEPDRTPSGQAW